MPPEEAEQLTGQPRAVVFHVKEGREHAHAVWSRVDTDKMRMIQMDHYKQKLRNTAQEFAKDHDLELPEGMKKDRGKDRFADKARTENLAEQQQEERSGLSKEDRRASITQAWKESDNPQAFIKALEAKGYYLAKGDRRAFVVIDKAGEVHSLSRQIEGARVKDIQARLADYPLDRLPGIEAAQEYAARHRQAFEEKQREQQSREDEAQKETRAEKPKGPTPQERRAQMEQRHQARRSALDGKKAELDGRHGSERQSLLDLHKADREGVLVQRAAKQPRG